MPYQVIKKIKGHSYRYEQSTYREGGKVRTISRYIGPANSETSSAGTVTHQADQVTLRAEEALQPTEQAQISRESAPEQEKEKLTLQNNPVEVRADLGKHKISETALQVESRRFLGFLMRKGLDPAKIAPVSVSKGPGVATKPKGRGYTVTVPRKRQKGARGEFWHTYRKTLARVYLDAIEEQDPRYFGGLKQNLSEAYRRQNVAISAYILHSKRSEVFKIGLTLHFLYTKMVSAWTQAHLAPEKIGLADYGQRRDWREDTAALMADIQREGWKPTYQKYLDALKSVENQSIRAVNEYEALGLLDKLSGKHRAKRQEIRKLNARRRAIFETCNKISVLSPLFQGYKDDIFGTEPFLHERNWERVKKRWKKRRK